MIEIDFSDAEASRTFRRNRMGRPYVITPDGREVTYTRCTTFIGVLDDKTNLHMWQTRLLTTYLVSRTGADRTPVWRELVSHAKLGEAADKRLFNAAIRAAHDEAGTKTKADVGTRVHAETQAHDEGIDFGRTGPGSPWLTAYVALTEQFEPVMIEEPVVLDEYEVAGTPDRIVETSTPCPECGRTRRVLDVKTGRVDQWTEREQAMQLAAYAHSKRYDVVTGEREDMDACQHEGIIVHLPADAVDPAAESSLVRLDIARGWELFKLAALVRAARKEKGLLSKW